MTYLKLNKLNIINKMRFNLSSTRTIKTKTKNKNNQIKELWQIMRTSIKI